MQAKYYIGVELDSNDLVGRKILNLKRKFHNLDSPHSHNLHSGNSHLQMSPFAPFFMNHRESTDLVEQLSDEIHSFFAPHDQLVLRVTGVELQQRKSKNVLALQVSWCENFNYCLGSLKSLCHQFGDSGWKVEKDRPMIILAKFAKEQDLNFYLDDLCTQVKLPAFLNIQSLSLYQNSYGHWSEAAQLFRFQRQVHWQEQALA